MRSPFPRWLALLAPLLVLSRIAAGEDLGKVYRGKMGWSGSGLFPECTADDVWQLKRFGPLHHLKPKRG